MTNSPRDTEEQLMHKLGWLLIGFGALLLLTRGGAGFLLFPLFFFWPFLLGALLFGLFARGPWACGAHGGHRSYYWRGRQGYYGHPRRGSSAEHSPERHDAERDEAPRANTGDTMRL
jgi:hypothetical protein